MQGAGEVLRGGLNTAVDRLAQQPTEVVQQSRNVALQGRQEMHQAHRPGQTGGSVERRPLPSVDERTRIL
jgi:hypothetical protein